MKREHKESGEEHEIFAIDDYFKHHVYGYKLPTGKIVTEDELERLYHLRKEATPTV